MGRAEAGERGGVGGIYESCIGHLKAKKERRDGDSSWVGVGEIWTSDWNSPHQVSTRFNLPLFIALSSVIPYLVVNLIGYLIRYGCLLDQTELFTASMSALAKGLCAPMM